MYGRACLLFGTYQWIAGRSFQTCPATTRMRGSFISAREALVGRCLFWLVGGYRFPRSSDVQQLSLLPSGLFVSRHGLFVDFTSKSP